MRKKFVYVVLVPVIVVLVVLYFFLDSWVESGLETAGEAAVGAKVEIDHLRLTLSPVGMEFARLQVANSRDPWKNLFETGRVKFALNFGQLLRGKYIVETMEVNDLILGTKRSTDGSLPKKPEPSPQTTAAEGPSLSNQADSLVQEKKKSVPVFDLEKLKKQFKVDSLLNVRNLQSVQHLDSLKTQIQQAGKQWQAALSDLDKSKQRVSDIETSVKAINVGELKTVQSVTAALKNVSDAQKGIQDVSETFKNRKNTLTLEINGLSASLGKVDDLVKQDYRGMLELARLPDLSMKGLAEMLLGKDVLDQAKEYLHWIDVARSTIKNSSSTPPDSKPPRMKGQNIAFPVERAYPKFWIKKILVSGGTDRQQDPNYFYAKGEILNVSSNQQITGFPLTVDLTATQGRGTHATLKASFDRRPDVPVDTYAATLTGLPVASMELGRSDFVPAKVSNAIAAISADASVPGKQFDANARVALSDLTVSFAQDPRTTIERLVHDVLAGVRAFNVRLRLWQRGGPLEVAFETDLDNLLAERTRKVLGDEVTKLRAELKQKLDQKIAEKRKEVERLFNEKKDEVTTRLKTYENLVNEKLALVDKKKKEVEDKVNAEKKKQEDSLKKKGEDALKNIFKKK